MIDKQFKYFIKYLIYFTVISAILVNYIDERFRFDIIRALILLGVLVIFFYKKPRLDKIAKLLVFFSIYILLESIRTYFFYGTFENKSIKILISSMVYIIPYNIVKTEEGVYSFSKIYLYSALFILLSILMLNFMGIEAQQVYSSDSINMGAQGVNTIKQFPFLLFPALIILINPQKKSHKYFFYIILISIVILILLGQKRGTLLGFLFGFLSFLFIIPNRKKAINLIIFVVGFLILAAPFFWDSVVSTYQAREYTYDIMLESDVNQMSDEDARGAELKRFINDFEKRNILSQIFGVGFASEMPYYRTFRMIHTDYTMFADGTGLFGLGLYLYIFYRLIKRVAFLNNSIKTNFSRVLYAISWSLIVLTLFTSISGFSHAIEVRLYFFMFFGAIIGYLESIKNIIGNNIYYPAVK